MSVVSHKHLIWTGWRLRHFNRARTARGVLYGAVLINGDNIVLDNHCCRVFLIKKARANFFFFLVVFHCLYEDWLVIVRILLELLLGIVYFVLEVVIHGEL